MKRFEDKKADFPIFITHSAMPFVYLDSAATAQKPSVVIQAVSDFYSRHNASPYRGIHWLSEEVTQRYEQVRIDVAQFINAHPEEVIFTKGATEGINFIADAWACNHLKKEDEILLTRVEHHANLLPWQRLAQKIGATINYIDLDKETLAIKNSDHIRALLTKRTKLVAVTAYSNVIGSIWSNQQALHQLIADAHTVGAKVLIDAAQYAPHTRLDIAKLNPDFLVISGHKMLGPTGVGILYIKKDLHEEVEPYQVGGSMVYSVSYEKSEWQAAPQKFEAGTPPVAQVLGLGAAVQYLNKIDFAQLALYETSLCRQAREGLLTLPGVRILGARHLQEEHDHLVTFVADGVHAHDIAAFLNTLGIAVRAGHHCAQPLASFLNADSSLRASFYLYSTLDDVNAFIKGVEQAISFLRPISNQYQGAF